MWPSNRELGVKTVKTAVVLFTRRYQPPTFLPLKLNETELKLKLELILDRKLSWKSNIVNTIKKASTALRACNRVLEKKWSLGPRMTHYIYAALVTLILTYECIVWWKYLDRKTNSKLMQRVKRSVCIVSSDALRTTPTSTLKIIFGIFSLDIF